MVVLNFIKKELEGWGKIERVIFPLGILFIIFLSLIINDSKIALISAVCGISYSILAGKGKISCFFFGLAGTLCYSYISYKNALFGNLALYMLFYLPMQITGIFKWRKHLKQASNEIEKTFLSYKERIIYFVVALLLTIILVFILKAFQDQSPIIDAITTIFSIFGLTLTVKRCIEQWPVWIVVNGLSTIMWIKAYMLGSNCFATILMWGAYFLLSIYFLCTWHREITKD